MATSGAGGATWQVSKLRGSRSQLGPTFRRVGQLPAVTAYCPPPPPGLGWLASAELGLQGVALWQQHCGEAGGPLVGRPATWPQRPLVALGIPARRGNTATSPVAH